MTLKRLNNLKPFEINKKWELIKTLTNSKNTNDPAEGISLYSAGSFVFFALGLKCVMAKVQQQNEKFWFSSYYGFV